MPPPQFVSVEIAYTVRSSDTSVPRGCWTWRMLNPSLLQREKVSEAFQIVGLYSWSHINASELRLRESPKYILNCMATDEVLRNCQANLLGILRASGLTQAFPESGDGAEERGG